MKAPRLLLLDLGNTDLVVVDWREGTVLGQGRVAGAELDTRRPAKIGEQIGRAIGGAAGPYEGAALVSVVPGKSAALARAAAALSGCSVVVADHRVRLPIRLRYDDPASLGPDRLVNAVGAWRLCPGGAIVVDAGTATTFEVIDERGELLGGLIAPGPDLGARALAEHTARLPLVSVRPPGAVVATSTEDAIISGLFHGTAALVEGLVARIRAELGRELPVIVTGGWAEGLLDGPDLGARCEPWLTFIGLAELWELNRPSPDSA